MQAVVDVYQAECKRLRLKLEEQNSMPMPELKPIRSITKSHMRLLDLMNEENKSQFKLAFSSKEAELDYQRNLNVRQK
jgi:hypothetical protein